MAILKIYNDIVGEEDKVMLQIWEALTESASRILTAF